MSTETPTTTTNEKLEEEIPSLPHRQYTYGMSRFQRMHGNTWQRINVYRDALELGAELGEVWDE